LTRIRSNNGEFVFIVTIMQVPRQQVQDLTEYKTACRAC
jgi:hypothetical protein